MFKIGDIVTGNKKSKEHYCITNHDAIMEVIEVSEKFISVKVIKSRYNTHIGETFRALDIECFELTNKQVFDEVELKPKKEIINDYSIY